MKKLAYKAESEKHAAKIIKHLKKSGTNKAKIKPIYVGEYYWLDKRCDLCCTIELPEGHEEGFLKSTPTKKELQSALSIVGDELANVRSRITALEYHIAEPKYEKTDSIENLKEGLPEKWCVLRTHETYNIINEWACKEWGNKFWYDTSGYVNSDKSTSDVQQYGYTEITFEQFKKWVLKEDDQPAAIDWSKAGQLVNNGVFTIYTDGSHEGDCFSGTRLGECAEYCTVWVKKHFTLKN